MREERRVRIVGAVVVCCCVLAVLGAATVAGVGGASGVGDAGDGHAVAAPSEPGALADDVLGDEHARQFEQTDAAATVCGERSTEEEPNDNRGRATTSSGGGVHAVGGISDSGDADWFAFDAQADIDVRIDANTFGDRGTEATLTLYTPDGSVVTRQAIADGQNSTSHATTEGAGTYYVRLTASGGETPCYSFDIDTYHREDEPNDERSNGTPIAPAWDTAIGGTLRPADDTADWYSFDVNAGQSIRVDRLGATVLGPKFSLVAPDGTVLDEESGNTESAALGTTATESGTYHVRVTPLSTGGGTYTFDVDLTGPDQREPNDDRASARPVAANTQFGATITETSPQDWYAVELDAGERLNATLTQTDVESAVENEVKLDIIGPDGTPVGEIPADPYSDLSSETGWAGTYSHIQATQRVTADTAGTYYVRAMGDRLAGFFTYSLSLETRDTTASDLREVSISAEGEFQEYTFSARRVLPGERANIGDGTDEIRGASVEGTIAEGGTDSYHVAGPIREFTADAPDRLTITIDGEEVDPASLGDEEKRTIRIAAEGDVQEYTLAAPNLTAGKRANIDDGTDVIEGETVSGTVGAGGADTYQFTGSIERFTADAPDRLTITIEGEAVDPATLGEEPPKTIWLRGTGGVQEYTISAPDLTPGERANVEDGTDVIEGETVSGTIGEGGVDTYHFSGSISEFRADVPGRLAVRIEDEVVDPSELAGGDATATPATATPTTRTTRPTATPTTTSTAEATRTPSTATATRTPSSTTTPATRTTESESTSTETPTVAATTRARMTATTAEPTESVTPTTEPATTTRTTRASRTTAASITPTPRPDTATPTAGSVGEIASGGTPTGTSTGSGPGVGIGGALVAILACLGALVCRRR